jgi:hypothetical protein
LDTRNQAGIEISAEGESEWRKNALLVVRPVVDGSANSERRARIAIEEQIGHRLGEAEWTRQKRNLVEFVETLARWDRERRSGACEPEVTQ